jgi:REP element-mobilizing transposase RayT
MPRAPHANVADGIYHVTSRGNRRETIFFDDYDYAGFLRRLGQTVERFGWLCHSYCVLPNHYHLLVETPEPNLSRGMLVLNGAYARRFNTRYSQVGHVFQGPFSCELVHRDEHFLECCRYIALNPVRAGLCRHPGDWRWSSYRALAGLEPAPSFLHVDFVHAMFGGAAGYRAFVLAGVEASNQVA